MPAENLIAISRLQRLMDMTDLMVGDDAIPKLLEEIARVLEETSGFAGVVINAYRPQWDDFQVTSVAGSPQIREALLGATYDRAAWLAVVLDECFARRGAYFIREGAIDWSANGARYLPDLDGGSDPDAWRPGDELFVPCRDSAGHILAVVSLGEPVSGRRPSDADLDYLVAIGASAACALDHGQRAQEAARHRAALEELLAVSSRLACQDSIELVLEAVCAGVARALGFCKVVIELIDPATRLLAPRASMGWPAGQEPDWTVPAAAIELLLDPAFEIGGCYLLPGETARELAPLYVSFVSEINGRGPLAWDHHWLFVPLRDRTGDVVGRIWADDPKDRLLPSRARLEALAVFANQATMAIVTAGQLEELRALAQEDPLTGLPNRRAFMRDLESELERTRRHGRPLALVLCDVDDLKHINDTHGHPGGDRALCAVGRNLRDALRAGDAAFRIGGDEFAVLMPETTAEQAAIVAARIAAPHGAERGPRLSCGIAGASGDGNDAETLIASADAALYATKRAPAEMA
ncbi:MAG TPA: GGDEF domain-containing protein [Solirubrobacteraceae bacterium]|nr:GGDEF domain-containing protein [Solirubrobacteraceae bacterium]